MKKKYLITGTTGFIGRSLLERLADSELMVIGREWSTDAELPHKIRAFNPTHIVHCAAEIKDPTKCFESNIAMTYWLLEATQEIPYNAFINIGSSSEYGAKSLPMQESDMLSPRTMYEATKGASSLLCQGFARHYDKPIATVRPFSVYGQYEPANRLIPTLFRNFENNQLSHISLGVHDFIHIDDFLDGVVSVLNSERKIIKGDIVHFGSGVQYTNAEVFYIIRDLFGSKLEYESVENTFNTYDTLNWVANLSYATTKYKFKPKYSLKTGLKEIYERKYK